MPRIQILIPDEMDKKLSLYSAFFNYKKAEYVRFLLSREIEFVEQNYIPSNLKQKAEEKGEDREK